MSKVTEEEKMRRVIQVFNTMIMRRVIQVFNTMINHISQNILSSEPDQIVELVEDFQAAKDAIESDDWREHIQKGEGFLLQEKACLIKKIDDLQPIIDKVNSMKAFW